MPKGLDPRKHVILKALVEEYIRTGEPVGSVGLLESHELGVSSATIRNEMADLEALGYLSQPHTSAGRVPSSRGYRFYVDSLAEPEDLESLEAIDARWIREAYDGSHDAETLIQRTAKLISEATRYTAMVLGPRYAKAVFRELKLIRLPGDRLLMVLVTDVGLVEHRIIDLSDDLADGDLAVVSRNLNRSLRGMILGKLTRGFARSLNQGSTGQRWLIGTIFDALGRTGPTETEDRVYLGGTANILNQPDFGDLGMVRDLLGFLEREHLVSTLLSDSPAGGGVRVFIGHENPYHELQNCSLVTAAYGAGGRMIGAIGVLGPTRMQYAHVMSVVSYVSDQLSSVLTRRMKR
ncbi:MAG TPA: heat-inducible transcriptional repressor HrcA [Bacillota bacterium]|jgi:heat-inducible transcriptional repressor